LTNEAQAIERADPALGDKGRRCGARRARARRPEAACGVGIDQLIDTTLQEGWKLPRVEDVMRAILRAGTYELKSRRDVPARVAIAEYADVAAAFLGRGEVGMINAMLDTLARPLRQGEFEGR